MFGCTNIPKPLINSEAVAVYSLAQPQDKDKLQILSSLKNRLTIGVGACSDVQHLKTACVFRPKTKKQITRHLISARQLKTAGYPAKLVHQVRTCKTILQTWQGYIKALASKLGHKLVG